MTIKRDLKKRIRERQKQTGERYTTARAQVLAGPEWVIELLEVPEHPGIFCDVRVVSSLWSARAQLLEQLRQILLGPIEGLEPMRRVVLGGGREARRGTVLMLVTRLREFRVALQQGLRGPAPDGRTVAFDAKLDGQTATIIAHLLPTRGRPLLLLLQFSESGVLFDSLDAWLVWRP